MTAPAAAGRCGRRSGAVVAALMLPLLGAACAGRPLPPSAALPPDAVQGAGDPTRAAILHAADAFSTPGRLAGRPEEAARAVAEVEHLAVELASGSRWVGFSPLAATQMAAARAEVRGALGVPGTAPPQAAIDQLFAASRAMRAGDPGAAAAVLSPAVFPAGGAATLNRLASLPPLPQTSAATAFAARELTRTDMDRGPVGRRGVRPL